MILEPPNLITEGEGFYISYNAVDNSLYGDVTTALVYGQMEAFFTLNGNHGRAYGELIPLGFEACLDYFRANIADANEKSEHKYIFPADGSVSTDIVSLIRAHNARLMALLQAKKEN